MFNVYKLFEICFYTGLVYAVVSFILGEIFQISNFDSIDLNMDVDIPDVIVSPIRPTVIATFITSFGGVGLMFLKLDKTQGIALFAAIISALIISFAFYKLIIVPLTKAQNSSAPSHEQLIGHGGKLILGISNNGFGEIIYTINGNSFNSPAKTLDGHIITKGTEVKILSIKDGVFYVTEIVDNEYAPLQ